jgi:MFS family permease
VDGFGELSLVISLALVWGYVGLNRTGIGFILPPIVDDSTVFSALVGAGSNFVSLFAARDLLGLGEGVGFSVGRATIADETSASSRGLYQGIFNAGYTVVGLGIGAFVMTHLATALGWRWAYPVVALFGVAMVTVVAILLPFRRRTTPAEPWRPSALFKEVGSVLRVPGTRESLSRPPLTCVGLVWVGDSVHCS